MHDTPLGDGRAEPHPPLRVHVTTGPYTDSNGPAYPVVAIGGIGLAQVAQGLACGVDSIAVVSALAQAADPRAVAEAFLRLVPTA